jgi:Flp pilus assembly secretin CpaC
MSAKKKFACISCLVVAVVIGFTLQVQGKPALSNVSITDAVEDELQLDQAVPAYEINVAAVDGIVTLSGSVDNLLAKERAARIARTVKGVRAVVNKIQVIPPLLRSDGEIREEVNDALLWDAATESY